MNGPSIGNSSIRPKRTKRKKNYANIGDPKQLNIEQRESHKCLFIFYFKVKTMMLDQKVQVKIFKKDQEKKLKVRRNIENKRAEFK